MHFSCSSISCNSGERHCNYVRPTVRNCIPQIVYQEATWIFPSRGIHLHNGILGLDCYWNILDCVCICLDFCGKVSQPVFTCSILLSIVMILTSIDPILENLFLQLLKLINNYKLQIPLQYLQVLWLYLQVLHNSQYTCRYRCIYFCKYPT